MTMLDQNLDFYQAMLCMSASDDLAEKLVQRAQSNISVISARAGRNLRPQIDFDQAAQTVIDAAGPELGGLKANASDEDLALIVKGMLVQLYNTERSGRLLNGVEYNHLGFAVDIMCDASDADVIALEKTVWGHAPKL